MKLRKKMASLLVLSFLATPLVQLPTAYAVNPQIINYNAADRKVEFTSGAIYWTTSSIREWLNSNQTTVQYTNDAPPYANEVGFLNEFTQEEYEAIAITKRRTHVHNLYAASTRDGGSGNIARYDGYEATRFLHVASPNIQKNWTSLFYQDVNEKAFILSLHELYEYTLKRGWSMQRKLTAEEMQRLNRSNPYYSYFTSTYNYSTTENNLWGISEDGKAIYGGSAVASQGIVPALHVKPTHVFNDGRVASSLHIGDNVTFGVYHGEPIEWDVINVTADGYPLLWSNKILTIKRYDQPGTKVLRNSESATFETPDVLINTHLQYKNQQGSTDTIEPSLRVANDTDLRSRRNDKFTLILEATDEEGGSGIDYVLLPDGTKDYRSMVTYDVLTNGRYDFVAVDKAGNQFGIQVPVGNISPPPSVLITSSSNGWTNKDVTVNIKTSLEQYTDMSIPSLTTTGSRSSGNFSNYASYSGKKYRISGKVRFVSKSGVKDSSAGVLIRMPYRILNGSASTYYVSYIWDAPVWISMPTLINANGSFVSFDTVYTVWGSYYDSLYAYLDVFTAYGEEGKYKVEWKDVKIELQEKEEIYINKIVLPNGTEIVGQNNYSELLTQPGNYTYKVFDSRGKVTEKTINVTIDKVLPTATHTITPSGFTNQDAKITVKGLDTLSGVKRMLKPNGEWVTGDTVEYYAANNGTYHFTIEDNAGNTVVYPVVINTVDKQKPVVTFLETAREWDLAELAVPIKITDPGVSGVKQYRYAWSTKPTKPTDGWSGWYNASEGIVTYNKEGIHYLHIEAVDHAGNETHAYSGVYRKLKDTEPMVGFGFNPQPGNWTNEFINVSITENLNYAGNPYIEKRYEITSTPIFPTTMTKTLPSSGQLLLNQQGVNYIHLQYTFENGTRVKQSVGPYLIDTAKIGAFTAQLVNVNGQAVNDWSKNSLYLAISNPTTPSVSGYVKQYRIEGYDYDWQTYQDGMSVSVEGENRIFTRVMNKAGTMSEQKILTAKYDKEIPQVNALKLKLGTDGKYNVSVSVKDSYAGVKEVRLNTATGVMTTSSANEYFSFNQVASKPVSITVIDHANNATAVIPFASLPNLTFAPPYQLNAPTYRGKVVATISNGAKLRYQIGTKITDCTSQPCTFTLERNATINAIHIEGNKQSERAVKLSNINNGPLTLVLKGTRNASDKKITLTWDYAITGGTVSCYEGETLKTFAVSNTSYTFTGINTNYDCQIKGKIGTETVESNRLLIYADNSQPIEGGGATNAFKGDVYIEESRIGTSYFINAKSTNQQDASVQLPIEPFH